MSSCAFTPLSNVPESSQASASNSQTDTTDVFARMMGGSRPILNIVVKDKCPRLIPQYNDNYNPEEPPRADLPRNYSPYVRGEPLHDNRNVVVAHLPSRHTVAPPPKRPRIQWVWNLGYAINNNTKAKSILVWCCKHCKLVFFLLRKSC